MVLVSQPEEQNKIESEKVLVNWRDVESITKEARNLLIKLEDDDIFVNIALSLIHI